MQKRVSKNGDRVYMCIHTDNLTRIQRVMGSSGNLLEALTWDWLDLFFYLHTPTVIWCTKW